MTTPSARGRGRPRAGQELDVASLLSAALEAFAETGYEGTSVRELSRRLGVSHALLTARFGSKEGLWFAAIEHALTEVERSWEQVAHAPAVDDLEALREGIIRQVRFTAAHPQVQRIMEHEGAIDSPRVRFVFERFVSPLRPGVEQLLARLVEAGRIRPIPYATLHFLLVAGGGAPYSRPVEAMLLGAPVRPGEAEIRAHAETVADVLIRGILVAPPDGGPACPGR